MADSGPVFKTDNRCFKKTTKPSERSPESLSSYKQTIATK